MKLLTHALLLPSCLFALAAQGDLIVYEPFDYYHKAGLPGCDGGTGFDGPWYQVSAKDVINPDKEVANPDDDRKWTANIPGDSSRCGGVYRGDLAVAGLLTQGGHYGNHFIEDRGYQWRKLANSFDHSTTNDDLWVSFVVQWDYWMSAGKSVEEKLRITREYRTRQYDSLIDAVFKRRGWTNDGCPTPEHLKEIGMDLPEVLEVVKARIEGRA